MSKTDYLKKTLETIVVAAALALLACIPVLALKIYFADSEIWSVNLGYHFAEEFKHYWVFTRTVFYSLIYISTAFTEKSEWIFFAARLLMCINLFVQLYLVQRILDVLFKNRLLNWVSTLILLTNTFVLTQGYRVRSDLIAATFVLWTLLMILTSPHRQRFVIIGTCLILLSTPKFIFVLPAVLILYFGVESNNKNWRYPFILLGLGVAAYLGAMIFRLGALSDLVMDMNSYVVRAVEGGAGGAAYFSIKAFTYIGKFCRENVLFVGLLSLPLLLSTRKKFWLQKENRIWMGVHAFTILVIVLMPDRVPFFISSFLPLLTCSSLILIWNNLRHYNLKPEWLGVLLIWVGVSLFLSVQKGISSGQNNSNETQMAAIKSVDAYLTAYPDLTYYDVIGIVPRKSTLRHFAGPHQEETNKMVSKIIMHERPDLILKVAKFWFFDIEMSNFLAANYIDIGNGFYLKSFPGPTEAKGAALLKSLAHKESFANVSPLFEKYKGTELIFKTRDKNNNSRLYLGVSSYSQEKNENIQVVSITPFPYPETMPQRNLTELFRFDTDF